MTDGKPRQRGINLQYELLENSVSDRYTDLINLLDEEVEAVPACIVFVNPVFELEHPGSIAYSNVISDAVAAERAGDRARMAGYRAFHFAHRVGNLLLGASCGMRSEEFFEGVDSQELLKGKLTFFVAEYLASRPTLDCFVSRFMPELDPSGEFGDVAEVVAGSTFMFIEANERERAVNTEAGAFTRELEGFRGFDS